MANFFKVYLKPLTLLVDKLCDDSKKSHPLFDVMDNLLQSSMDDKLEHKEKNGMPVN